MGSSESKAKFAEQLQTFTVLESLEDKDDHFWDSLLEVKLSVEDVFELVSPAYVRLLVKSKPENLRVFLERVHLAILKTVDGEHLQGDSVNRTRNSVLLVTRMMPFLLEDPCNNVVFDIFWKTTLDLSIPCLANRLLSVLMRLLFHPGYCIHLECPTRRPDSLPTDQVDTQTLWASGFGCSLDTTLLIKSDDGSLLTHRLEILRCIRSCLSGSLFASFDEYRNQPNPWLIAMTSGDLPFTANLFCSISGTVLSYDAIGLGLPYGSAFSSSDLEEELTEVALQLFCVLIDFSPEVFNVHQVVNEGEEVLVGMEIRNVFRLMASEVKNEEEVSLFVQEIGELLETLIQARNTFLPNSMKPIAFYQEILILLWHCLNCNSLLLETICSATALAGPSTGIFLCLTYTRSLVFVLLNNLNSRSNVGLVHLCAFLLLKFSSSREFAVKLNEKFPATYLVESPDIQFQGTYADLLILSITKAISETLSVAAARSPPTTSSAQESFIEMLLTIYCNISPFIKCFSQEAVSRVMPLLEKLVKKSSNSASFSLLLEAIICSIQYQAEGNTAMIYSILRQKASIERVISLSENSVENQGRIIVLNSLLENFLPKIEKACHDKELTDQDEVMQLIKSTTLVGLLPIPIPFVTRQLGFHASSSSLDEKENLKKQNSYTLVWFTSFLWGVIFVKSQNLPLFDWQKIKLILITQSTANNSTTEKK